MIDLNELRQRAIEYQGEAEIGWTRKCFAGGDGPQTANFWYVEGRPDLSWWPFPEQEGA